MGDVVRWGILGTGQMAHKFAAGLAGVSTAKLLAVASRDETRAAAFANSMQILRSYAQYEGLLDDPDIDAVYIATPIARHCDDMLRCLAHGKAVLCEKAFVLHAAQAAAVIAKARENKLFLMEAMWMRYLPAMRRVRQWLESGLIGTVHMVTGSLGFPMEYNPQSLFFAPEAGGGALLSVGVYAVNFASMVLGWEPIEIFTVCNSAPSGVDEQFALTLHYKNCAMASFACSLGIAMSQKGYIYGEKGHIYLQKFFAPREAVLFLDGCEPEVYAPPYPADDNGYSFEAAEACACILKGRIESAAMPLDETLAVMRVMDEMRLQWNRRDTGKAAARCKKMRR